MLKNLKNRLNENKGFSLVELIVVIAIMVILIALLVPNVVGYISKAQDSANLSAAKSVYNAINTAVIDYKAKTGSYPKSTDLKDTLDDQTGTAEALVVVPKGTAVAVSYDGNGTVYFVACSTSTADVNDASAKNLQAYSPYASGNCYADSTTLGGGGSAPSNYVDDTDITAAVSCLSWSGAGGASQTWSGGTDVDPAPSNLM